MDSIGDMIDSFNWLFKMDSPTAKEDFLEEAQRQAMAYSGLPNESVVKFLREFEILVQKTKISDKVVLRAFPDLLRDYAWDWFSTLSEKFYTWQRCKEVFITKFLPPYPEMTLADQILSRSQLFTERPSDFVRDIREMVRKLPTPISETTLVATTCKNLLPFRRDQLCKYPVPKSLAELEETCKRIDSSFNILDYDFISTPLSKFYFCGERSQRNIPCFLRNAHGRNLIENTENMPTHDMLVKFIEKNEPADATAVMTTSSTERFKNVQNIMQHGMSSQFRANFVPTRAPLINPERLVDCFLTFPRYFIKITVAGLVIESLVDTGCTHSCGRAELMDVMRAKGVEIRALQTFATAATGGLADVTGFANLSVQLGSVKVVNPIYFVQGLRFGFIVGMNTLKSVEANINLRDEVISIPVNGGDYEKIPLTFPQRLPRGSTSAQQQSIAHNELRYLSV